VTPVAAGGLRSRRRSGSRRHDDTGASLVELAVAMLVTGVLMAAVGTTVIGTMRVTNTLNSKVSTSGDARTAADQISRALRATVKPPGAAAALTAATATGITFYAMLNRPGVATFNGDVVPTKVEYYVSGTCLMQAQTPGTVVGGVGFSWPAGGRATRCILRSSTAPAFQYYNSGTTATQLTLPLADLSVVRSVGVTVTATNVSDPTLPGSVLKTRVILDNVALQDTGGTA